MNQLIEFKKDCIMKTVVAEVTDISLTHDYKVLDDVIDGYFDVSGEYKVTKASMQKEEFMYTIPFTIALSSLIDKNTINLTIKDFNYAVEKDVLHLKMDLDMNYEEIKEETKEEITLEDENVVEEEEEIMESVEDVLESIPEVSVENDFHDEVMQEMIEQNENIIEEKVDIADKEEAQTSIKNIISNMKSDGYYKYKVYIMREEDTIESVAIKYSVTLDDLKEYNELDSIKCGSKIVIPYIKTDEEDK